jgi:hypothetical protein
MLNRQAEETTNYFIANVARAEAVFYSQNDQELARKDLGEAVAGNYLPEIDVSKIEPRKTRWKIHYADLIFYDKAGDEIVTQHYIRVSGWDRLHFRTPGQGDFTFS